MSIQDRIAGRIVARSASGGLRIVFRVEEVRQDAIHLVASGGFPKSSYSYAEIDGAARTVLSAKADELDRSLRKIGMQVSESSVLMGTKGVTSFTDSGSWVVSGIIHISMIRPDRQQLVQIVQGVFR